MSYYSEDEGYDHYGPQRHDSRGADNGIKDVGSALHEKVCVSDDGKLRIFGKEVDVGGREVAFFLGPAIDTVMASVAAKGASVAGKAGTAVAEFARMPKGHAAKVGKGAYYLWLFGLSGADVLLSIKKTVQDGIREIHELREQAQPLLAANNDKEVGLGSALTSKNPVLAQARAKVYADFRHNLHGTLATAIRVLPMVAIGYNQARLDNIIHPEHVKELKFRKNMTPAQEKELNDELSDLRKRQIPKEAWEEERKKVQELRERRLRPGFPKTAEEYSHPDNEEVRLLGKYLGTPHEQKEQNRLLGELRELKSVPQEHRDQYEYKSGMKETIEELEYLRRSARKQVAEEVAGLSRTRRKHRDGLGNKPIAATGASEHEVVNMFNWFADAKARKRMFSPDANDNHAADYRQNISHLMTMPAAARMLGDIVDHKLSREAPDTAWDKIMDLQHAVERHQHDLDRDIIVVKVKDIFKQYAHDQRKTYSLDGSSYNKAAEAIADAIVDEKLHPQAMAEILADKKIVDFGKTDADFGGVQDVKAQLERLVLKYNSKVGEQEVYTRAPFTRETLAKTFGEIPDEEKPFFTMLFPPGVLEKAGVPKEEVQKNRDAGRQDFVGALTAMTRTFIDMGSDKLKKQGIHSAQTDALEALKGDFRAADENGEAREYIHDNMRDVTRVVRNIAASAKQPGEMWKEYVARQESTREGLTPRTAIDHARRESPGDEAYLG